jgi:hypothetical protein
VTADELPVSRSFVVQFTRDTVPGVQRVHGRIEHIDSGRSRRFESLEELIAFVEAVLAAHRVDDDA